MAAKKYTGLLLGSTGVADETKKLLSALSGRVFVFDPFDGGDDSWLKRDGIIDRIKGLAPIKDPAGVFKTVLISEDERELRNIVEALATRIRDAIRDGRYADAASTLEKLSQIDKVDNAVCTRLLGGACERVDAALRALEKKALTHAMSGETDMALSIIENKLKPAAKAFEAATAPEATTERVTNALALYEQRKMEQTTFTEAIDALKQANADRQKLEGLVQGLKTQSEETDKRVKELIEEKKASEAKEKAKETAMKEAFAAEQRKLTERIAEMTSEREKMMLKEQQVALKELEQEKLKEQAEQAARDAQAQEALIAASKAQAEKAQKQLEEAQIQLGVQKKAVDLRAAMKGDDLAKLEAALATAKKAPAVDAEIQAEGDEAVKKLKRRRAAATALDTVMKGKPIEHDALESAIKAAREAEVEAAKLEAAQKELKRLAAEKAAKATGSPSMATSTLRLTGATGSYATVNGDYTPNGTHNGKPLWRKDSQCAIFHAGGFWKVCRQGSFDGWGFSGGEGDMPVVGRWGTRGCSGTGELMLTVVGAAPDAWSSERIGENIALTDGGKLATKSKTNDAAAVLSASPLPSSGVYFIEVTYTRGSGGGSLGAMYFTGVLSAEAASKTGARPKAVGDSAGFWGVDDSDYMRSGGKRDSIPSAAKTSDGRIFRSGDRVGLLIDMNAHTMSIYCNGKRLPVTFSGIPASVFVAATPYNGGATARIAAAALPSDVSSPPPTVSARPAVAAASRSSARPTPRNASAKRANSLRRSWQHALQVRF